LGCGPFLQQRLPLHCLNDLPPRFANVLLVLLIQMGFQLGLDNALLVALAYGNAMCWQIIKYGVKWFHCINLY
jgi:hypothetical protein